jgi:hypothetical protein
MARAPNIEMGVVVGFSEVFDRAPTVEGAQAILAQYNRDSVLVVLAKLSAALRLWFGPDYAKDNGLACDVFLNAARVLRQTLKGRPPRLFFYAPRRARDRAPCAHRVRRRWFTDRPAWTSGACPGVLLDDERTHG